MKHLFTTLLFLIFGLTTYAQENTELARFIISDVRMNDIDVTKTFVDGQSYLVLYTPAGSKELYFASIRHTDHTQSYGRIYDQESSQVDATSTQYKSENYKFKWSYANSYDNKQGTATITMELVYKPNGTAFTCKVVTEALDVLVYRGYVSGSLK
ncbi:hypothetical protein KXQ82_10365 [Mucilaginibacter sp. HMF5004]|uniref:hypothetical protein n=1 Tax=Mucilaginibacter rivuli TaxID=2857527 RepID=UPI001C5FDA4C|nr:hypothetical protein [Mucilaginibacter rivuli]MBW4890122.1 hypothetical protein [Mucilaginibacter rivuli]